MLRQMGRGLQRVVVSRGSAPRTENRLIAFVTVSSTPSGFVEADRGLFEGLILRQGPLYHDTPGYRPELPSPYLTHLYCRYQYVPLMACGFCPAFLVMGQPA